MKVQLLPGTAMTIQQDLPPAIGSEFNPHEAGNQGAQWHNTVIATGLHGTNDVNPNVEISQWVVLVASHRSGPDVTKQDRTWSCSYEVYVVERIFDGNDPTDKWKILYEQDFSNIQTAVNGHQFQHARWATEAEKREPAPWLAGFKDCLDI